MVRTVSTGSSGGPESRTDVNLDDLIKSVVRLQGVRGDFNPINFFFRFQISEDRSRDDGYLTDRYLNKTFDIS